MKKSFIIILFMLGLVAVDNALPQGLDRLECFIAPNGDTHCYDTITGRKIVLRRV